MGKIVLEHEATLERFTGDAIMVFLGDPLPIERPTERALSLALAMRAAAIELSDQWRRRGADLGLAIGVAQGFATVGAIGFEGRIDYGAIGTVTNLAARLCGEAAGDQILISQRVYAGIGALVEVEPQRVLNLKGFHRPIVSYSVRALKTTQH